MKTGKKLLDDLFTDLKIGLHGIYNSLKSLYLYGSYARGEEDEESDLEILVVLEHFDHYAAEVTGQGNSLQNDHASAIGLFHDQHRAVRVAQRSFRHAAQQQPLQPGSSVTAHDNHRRLQLFHLLHDHIREVRSSR